MACFWPILYILSCWMKDILLFVCSKLDYDFISDHKYEFSVIATDGGSPPLSASAMVQVIIALFFYYFIFSFASFFFDNADVHFSRDSCSVEQFASG